MDIPSGYLEKFKITPKAEEHVELCKELAPVYGKIVWSLPHRVGFTEHKIREAHKICQSRGILTVGYLIGVIKKLR